MKSSAVAVVIPIVSNANRKVDRIASGGFLSQIKKSDVPKPVYFASKYASDEFS